MDAVLKAFFTCECTSILENIDYVFKETVIYIYVALKPFL